MTDHEIQQLALSLNYSDRSLRFQDRASRDAVAAYCRSRGIRVKRSTVRNQLLDPRYTVEEAHGEDLGLGNDYRHYFDVLYCLRAKYDYER